MRNEITKMFFLLFISNCTAQVLPIAIEDFEYDDNSEILKTDKSFFEYMLNTEFSKLVTGNSFTGLGNYATISTEDDNLSASLNFVFNSGVLDVEINGGSSEGITNFLTENEINSSVGLELFYHINIEKKGKESYKNFIELEIADLRRIEDEEKKLLSKYELEAHGLINKESALLEEQKKKEESLRKKTELLSNLERNIEYKLELLYNEIELLKEKVKYYSNDENLKAEIGKLVKKRDNPKNSDVFKQKTFVIDSIKLYELKNKSLAQQKEKEFEYEYLNATNVDYKRELLENEIEGLKTEISIIEKDIEFHKNKENRLKNQLRNEYIDKIRDNRSKIFEIKPTDVKLSWLTLGFGSSSNSYDFFDANRPEADRFFETKDLTWSFTLSYSTYKNFVENSKKIKNRNVRFRSFGIKGNINNNIDNIGKVEIQSIEELDTSRVISAKEAFQGDFEDGILTGLAFYDYYRFIGSKDDVGFHGRATLEFGEIEPRYSIRTGIIIPFKSTKNKGSFLNLELFAGLVDIFNSDSENSLFERNIIGVQATVPFNFKIL